MNNQRLLDVMLDVGTLSELVRPLGAVLDEQGISKLSEPQIALFAEHIRNSVRWRQKWTRQLVRVERLSKMDILYWIAIARNDDDLDEALWRGFLAGHFGRPSAHPQHSLQIESAGKFLCASEAEPVWTWCTVSSTPHELEAWLLDHKTELAEIRFGNHRKRESKQPKALFDVITSFIDWVDKAGGSPSKAFWVREGTTREVQFDMLFHALKPIHRFGRTGRFDMLLLLADMKLLNIRPGSAYLKGATGPKRGAEKLWGYRSGTQLDELAVDLARQLSLPVEVIEDALCNWQK